MIPTTQVCFGPVSGDCYRAALASIFEEPLTNFPRDLSWARVHGDAAFRLWLRKKGFAMKTYVWPDGVPAAWPGIPGAWHMLGGQSPREGLHATVGMNGVMVWDPHPSRAGLIGVRRDVDIFIPLTPEADELIHRPMRQAPTSHTGVAPQGPAPVPIYRPAPTSPPPFGRPAGHIGGSYEHWWWNFGRPAGMPYAPSAPRQQTGASDPWLAQAVAKLALMDSLVAQGRGDTVVPGGGCTEPGGGIVPTTHTARDMAAMLRQQLSMHSVR